MGIRRVAAVVILVTVVVPLPLEIVVEVGVVEVVFGAIVWEGVDLVILVLEGAVETFAFSFLPSQLSLSWLLF